MVITGGIGGRLSTGGDLLDVLCNNNYKNTTITKINECDILMVCLFFQTCSSTVSFGELRNETNDVFGGTNQ